MQEIAAAGYRGRTVTFRGQLRTTGIAGQAGLHLAVSVPPAGLFGAQLRDHGGSSLTATSRRIPMTAVRIAHADLWPGRTPDGGSRCW